MELPPGIDVVEGESDGFGLLEVIMNTDRLIIIDSVKGGGPPGSA